VFGLRRPFGFVFFSSNTADISGNNRKGEAAGKEDRNDDGDAVMSWDMHTEKEAGLLESFLYDLEEIQAGNGESTDISFFYQDNISFSIPFKY
jgi:hypothetical protein